jgi:hypothetical protein
MRINGKFCNKNELQITSKLNVFENPDPLAFA